MKSEIRYEVKTFYFERFLENAANAGFTLFELEKTGENTHAFSVSGAGHRRFRAFLKEYAVRAKILKKRGLSRVPMFWAAHPAFVLFTLAALLLVYFMSGRIWVIEADSRMTAALSELGVQRGMKKSSVREISLSRQLSALFPECAFIGVSVRGVYLTVDARYEEEAPEIYRPEEQADLVAAWDGIVETVFVQAGSACVKPGDAVKKGEVLIRGEERAGKNGETVSVQAKGAVTARVWTQAEAQVALTTEKKRPTGDTAVQMHLKTPFFTRTLSGENPFDTYDTATETIHIIGLFLPVTVEKSVFTEYTLHPVRINGAEAETAARAAAVARARSLMKADAEEQKLWTHLENTEGGALCARAVVEWSLQIAEKQGG